MSYVILKESFYFECYFGTKLNFEAKTVGHAFADNEASLWKLSTYSRF